MDLTKLQEDGRKAFLSNLSLIDNPYWLPTNMPLQTHDTIDTWVEKIDAWEKGWNDAQESTKH